MKKSLFKIFSKWLGTCIALVILTVWTIHGAVHGAIAQPFPLAPFPAATPLIAQIPSPAPEQPSTLTPTNPAQAEKQQPVPDTAPSTAPSADVIATEADEPTEESTELADPYDLDAIEEFYKSLYGS